MSDRSYDPENAEFHREQDFDFTLLETIIPKFDSRYKKNLKERMIEDCKSIQTRSERLSIKIEETQNFSGKQKLKIYNNITFDLKGIFECILQIEKKQESDFKKSKKEKYIIKIEDHI